MTIKSTLNHIQVYVGDEKISFPFYKELLTYLSYTVVDENEHHLGMRNGQTDIWLKAAPKESRSKGFSRRNIGVNHIAFGVEKKEDVDKFFKEFLHPRKIHPLYSSPKKFPQYTQNYYAVFFEDPDGLKLEVVFL